MLIYTNDIVNIPPFLSIIRYNANLLVQIRESSLSTHAKAPLQYNFRLELQLVINIQSYEYCTFP